MDRIEDDEREGEMDEKDRDALSPKTTKLTR